MAIKNTTFCRVDAKLMHRFDKKRIIRGIYWELVTETVYMTFFFNDMFVFFAVSKLLT